MKKECGTTPQAHDEFNECVDGLGANMLQVHAGDKSEPLFEVFRDDPSADEDWQRFLDPVEAKKPTDEDSDTYCRVSSALLLDSQNQLRFI